MEIIVPTKDTLKHLKSLGATRVIFCNLDAITGRVWTPVLAAQYGKMNIIHQLRPGREDWENYHFIEACEGVILTCWDAQECVNALGFLSEECRNSTRIYRVGTRIY